MRSRGFIAILFNQGAKLVQTECTAKEKACFFICSAEVQPNLTSPLAQVHGQAFERAKVYAPQTVNERMTTATD